MKKNLYFLSHQIARFGALTVPQMLNACSGKCSQATLYRMLDDLLRERLVKRIFLGEQAKHLFAARPSLYELVYGEEHQRSTGVSEYNSPHASLVAETILKLCRYSFVSGVATEYEITPNEAKSFCYSRVPDGIVQIVSPTQSFALAIEMERSRKDVRRIEVLLENYRQTFLRQMPCEGLLIVASNPTIAENYQTRISKMPTDIESRMVVTTPQGLSTLNQKYFGELTQNPSVPLEKIVNFSQGEPTFSRMFSTTYNPLTPPHAERQSHIIEGGQL